MARHILKTDGDAFQASWDEKKQFEVRLDDRDYKVGDYLFLLETRYNFEEMRAGKLLEYTGRWLEVQIIYKLKGYGIKDGWCILGHTMESGEEYIPESSEFEALLNER